MATTAAEQFLGFFLQQMSVWSGSASSCALTVLHCRKARGEGVRFFGSDTLNLACSTPALNREMETWEVIQPTSQLN